MYCRILQSFAVWKKRCEGETRTAGAEKNESREAVPRAGVEINTAVKDAGKAERKAVVQKKTMPEKKRNRQSMNDWKSIRESSRKSREKISRREELIWV